MTSAPLQTRRPPIKADRRVRLLVALLSFCAGIVAGLSLALMAESKFDGRAAAASSSDLAKLPPTQAALVIGTSYIGPNGGPNRRFEARLDAAAALWKTGKVKYLIASGNLFGSYNEPLAMRSGLVARGVPPEAISLDYAGTRTHESVLRARDIYRQYRILIVGQRETVGRALYVASHSGMEAWGYDARGADPSHNAANRVRRSLSALSAFLGFWLRTKPRDIRPLVPLGKDAWP